MSPLPNSSTTGGNDDAVFDAQVRQAILESLKDAPAAAAAAAGDDEDELLRQAMQASLATYQGGDAAAAEEEELKRALAASAAEQQDAALQQALAASAAEYGAADEHDHERDLQRAIEASRQSYHRSVTRNFNDGESSDMATRRWVEQQRMDGQVPTAAAAAAAAAMARASASSSSSASVPVPVPVPSGGRVGATQDGGDDAGDDASDAYEGKGKGKGKGKAKAKANDKGKGKERIPTPAPAAEDDYLQHVRATGIMDAPAACATAHSSSQGVKTTNGRSGETATAQTGEAGRADGTNSDDVDSDGEDMPAEALADLRARLEVMGLGDASESSEPREPAAAPGVTSQPLPAGSANSSFWTQTRNFLAEDADDEDDGVE